MVTATANLNGTAGYEQIQAIISGLATYEGREISLPDIDRFAVEQDVVAVTSASVALISESMKAQLDRVQGLSTLESLFQALIDQGLITGDGTDDATPSSILTNAIYELMLANFEPQEGASDEDLLNGLLGTVNGLTFYLTESESFSGANQRRSAGDGVWSEHNATGSAVIDLAYLDAQQIYDQLGNALGWDKLESLGIAPISEASTLEEIIATFDTIEKTQSVTAFANEFAHAMVGSQLVDINSLDIPSGIVYHYFADETYELDSDQRIFDLDEDGNISFTQVFHREDLEGPTQSTSVMAPMWMTTYNPSEEAGMGTYVLFQGQALRPMTNAVYSYTREDTTYLSAGDQAVYEGTTSPITMIESLYFAIERDPAFKEYLFENYDLTDPSLVPNTPPDLQIRDIDNYNSSIDFTTELEEPYNTDEYKIQPPRLQAMQAVVQAAFQEMSQANISTADLVQAAGGTVTSDSVTMDDSRPSNWETGLAAIAPTLTAHIPSLLAAADMFEDLTTLNPTLGDMTLNEIKFQMQSTLDGTPTGLDYGSGFPGSALPFLDEFTYRYGGGPGFDAVQAAALNDMGSLKDLSVDAFLSNAKLARESLSSTTQTLLLDVKNAQAKLEGALELLDSAFEDVKNAMRDLFSNW